MRYIARAVKYFIYFFILLALLLGIMIVFKLTGGGIESIFKEGWTSVGKIAILFALVSSVYPLFGFVKKTAIIPGEYVQIKDDVIRFMQEKGYRLEKEEGENLTFRDRGAVGRLLKMYEDRLTFTRSFSGFEIEGLRKDVIRIVYGLESAFRNDNNQE